jgi:hypothetical protein
LTNGLVPKPTHPNFFWKITFSVLKVHLNPFHQPTKTEYFQNAINFANSANLYARYYFDVKYYSSRNKILVIKWDIQTKEFIAVYLDGRVFKLSDFR